MSDVDAKRFYEMRDHDARLLESGDLLYHGEELRFVKEVRKSRSRDGGDSWTVRLDSGYSFDPRSDVNNGSLRSITFWRPRRMFRTIEQEVKSKSST